jgi:serine/threonine protein kinase
MELQIADRRGEVIGGAYVLQDLLGVGGMGLVYGALHRSIDRVVVIKVPRPDLVDDRMVRQRFRIEALAGARVAHPNVARVLDYGEQHHLPYLVMEHACGARLGTLVNETMSIANAVDVVSQLLRGLAEIHVAGVVHGDIKSDNVIVEISRDGQLRPRLIDFGLARLLGEDSWRLDTSVVGTPEYLAPELILGAQPTIASDLYAVGVMLYELLTGATPFLGGSHADTMNRHLSDFARPVSAHRTEVSVALEQIVECALAKVPSNRFIDASSFLAALEAADVVEQRVIPVETFSTRASTQPLLKVEDLAMSRRPLAAGSTAPTRSPAVLARHAAAIALEQRDIDGYLVAHLELAHALIGDHELSMAILELERATAHVHCFDSKTSSAPVWRLQLILAGLYDCRGNRSRAFRLALEARAQATKILSAVGRQRADALLSKLRS